MQEVGIFPKRIGQEQPDIQIGEMSRGIWHRERKISRNGRKTLQRLESVSKHVLTTIMIVI